MVIWSRLCDHAAAVPAVPRQLGGLWGVRFLDEGVDMPVIVHCVFFELRTVEVPQLPFLDKVIDVFFVWCGRPCDHAETWFAFCSWKGR